MKKVIMLIAFIVVAITTQAQINANKTETFAPGKFFWNVPVTSTVDYLDKSDTLYYTLVTAKEMPTTYSVQVKIDEVTGTGHCAVIWAGRVFDTDAWTTITTVNYKGGGSDTTINFSDVSGANYYRSYRMSIISDTTTQHDHILWNYMKLWDR